MDHPTLTGAALERFEQITRHFTRENLEKAGIRKAARHLFPWCETNADLDREIYKLFSPKPAQAAQPETPPLAPVPSGADAPLRVGPFQRVMPWPTPWC